MRALLLTPTTRYAQRSDRVVIGLEGCLVVGGKERREWERRWGREMEGKTWEKRGKGLVGNWRTSRW